MQVKNKDLLTAIQTVSKIITDKNYNILDYISLYVKDNMLNIASTDTTVYTVVSLNAVIHEKSFSAIIKPKIITQVLKNIPKDAMVTLERSGNNLILSYDNLNSAIECWNEEHPVQEYPLQPTVNNDIPNFRISIEDLKSILDIKDFTDKDHFREYLMGTYVHTLEVENKKVLRAVSTDGFALGIVDCFLDSIDIEGVIIPNIALESLDKLIKITSDEYLTVYVKNEQVTFIGERIFLSTKLINVEYPRYNRIIPTNNDKVLEVNRKNLINAIKILNFIKGERLGLEIKGKKLKLFTKSSTIELDLLKPMEEISFSLNIKNLKKILSLITTENLELLIENSRTPMLIKQKSKLFILMPQEYS